MPPWHLDKSLGIQHFENDRSLSDAEIDTVVKWVAAGAPKGDMKDMPKPVEWPSDDVWNFEKLYGKPDLVLTVAGLHPEGRRDGRVVQARAGHRPDRGAVGARHRDAARAR